MSRKKYLVSLLIITGAFFMFTKTENAQAFAGGDGSSGSPYQISTCQELQDMNTHADANYILIQNIDCSATSSWNDGVGFAPIVYPGYTPFVGVLDGQRYTISNLYINLENNDGVALFYYMDSGATVKNLNFDNSEIHGQGNVGTLVAWGGDETGVNLQNVRVTNGKIILGTTSENSYVGGIAAVIYGEESLDLSQLSFEGDITGADNGYSTYYGGLFGKASYVTIVDSFSTGDIYYGGSNTGGLVGHLSGSVIKRSYSSMAITSSAGNVGGLVGRMTDGGIENSYASGEIIGDGYVGGLVGSAVTSSSLSIVNSYAAGDVAGNSYTGGLVGRDNGYIIENSYATGKVTNSYEYGGEYYIGGFIGYLTYSGSYGDFIKNCGWDTDSYTYAIGIDGHSEGPISSIDYNVSDNSVFYSKSHAIYTASDSAWDFSDVWYEHSSGYPTLRSVSVDEDEDNTPTNNTNSSDPERAYIKSWSASLYTDNNKSCSERLKLTIKGKHFDKDIKVFIGGKEASSVDRKSSKELTAKFCLEKLLSDKTDHKRKITVQNPDTEEREADKQIDLNNLENKNTNTNNTNNDYFSMKTNEGVKHIQTVLNKLGYLDQENITGTYGSITTEAIKKFQSDNNIEPTGFVGEKTRAKLKEKA